MSLILIRKSDSMSEEEAQMKLKLAVDDPLTVLLIVYGEGADIEAVLEVAIARASVKNAIRRVVYVPDVSVMSSQQKKAYFRKGKAAVSIGLDDKIAKTLTPRQARIRAYVEQAFVHAESQGVENHESGDIHTHRDRDIR